MIGNFGVNSPTGQLNFGQEVFMPDGTMLFANLVKLRNGVSVFDVLANDLRVGKDVSIRGTTGAPVLPAQEPFCPRAPRRAGAGARPDRAPARPRRR